MRPPLTVALDTSADVIAIRRALEHAPAEGVRTAPDLIGNWTPEGWFVCARCIGRIMARGCSLPRGCLPAWVEEPRSVCVGCEGRNTPA